MTADDAQGANPARLREYVAEELRVLLARRRMSGVELARKIGKSHTYVWRRLSGETSFDLDDLEGIGRVLGVEPVDLLPRAANLSGRSNLGKVPVAVRPRDTRPKGRSDAGLPGRPKGGHGADLTNRRTAQKRDLTPEERALITT